MGFFFLFFLRGEGCVTVVVIGGGGSGLWGGQGRGGDIWVIGVE